MNSNAINQILTQIDIPSFPDLIEVDASIVEALESHGYSEAMLLYSDNCQILQKYCSHLRNVIVAEVLHDKWSHISALYHFRINVILAY